jgi:hypothetical protein
MEERGELFAADSKLDYSYRSLNTSTNTTSTTRTIPIRHEEENRERAQLEDVPPNGYSLEEAITCGIFDPMTGLLKVPGTDREMSFKECLDLNIINASTGTVLSYGQTFSLKMAVERRILDATAHFINTVGNLITMKEAIDAGFVTFDTFLEEEENGEHIQSEFLQASQSCETSSSTMRRLTENIAFDTISGTYEVNPAIQPGELMTALKEGKILPSDIKVEDPSTGTKGSGNIKTDMMWLVFTYMQCCGS